MNRTHALPCQAAQRSTPGPAKPALRRLAAAWLATLALLLLNTAALAGEFAQGLFWRIDPPNGGAPSHVYGTVHIDDARALKLAPGVKTALAGSRVLALELVTDADSVEAFATASQLTEGRSLDQLMSPEDYTRVEDILRTRYGIPPYVTERMAPWSAYVTLNLPGPRMGLTVDELLHRMALKQNKPVEGLETVAMQIDAMRAIPEAQQVLLLTAAAREHDKVVDAVRDLLKRYLQEDLDGILSLQDLPAGELPADVRAAQDALLESVLYGRNPGMAARAAPLIDAGGAFIAVGALHLQGERGLLAELKKHGYRVTRVPLDNAQEPHPGR
ncbi:MAG: TraB/GumN family protein [Rhodocyclaceae bacterium]|nr:TraB/GumN family protein [Rhodocyclaceae bacterium]